MIPPAKPISLCDAVEEEIQEALEKMPEEDLGWQSMINGCTEALVEAM